MEDTIRYRPVSCFTVLDNILFMICGDLKVDKTEAGYILLSTEIFHINIYEQRYIYEPTQEYQETTCETLKPILLDRISKGYYNEELLIKFCRIYNIKN